MFNKFTKLRLALEVLLFAIFLFPVMGITYYTLSLFSSDGIGRIIADLSIMPSILMLSIPIAVPFWFFGRLILLAVFKLFNIDIKGYSETQSGVKDRELNLTSGDIGRKQPGVIMFAIMTFILAIMPTAIVSFYSELPFLVIVAYFPFFWLLIVIILSYILHNKK